MQKNETWELSKLPEGRKPIKSRWVFRMKRDQIGKIVRYKARIVAKGFTQIRGLDYDEIFAPVTMFTTLRILVAVSSMKNMEILQVDLKTAFLTAYGGGVHGAARGKTSRPRTRFSRPKAGSEDLEFVS